MDQALHAIRWVTEAALAPLDLAPPHVSLMIIAVVSALLMLVAIKRASPQRLVARSRDRMAACIYEMRLFLDAPRRVLAAQGKLLGWTAIYLATLLPPFVVLAAPLGLLYVHLEPRHGLAPLEAPSTVLLRIELAPGIDGHDLTVASEDRVRVTAPLLYAADESAAYARLAIEAPGRHRVSVRVGDRPPVDKLLVAEPGAAVVAPDRRGGWAHAWSLGAEPPPDGDAIRALSIEHPARPQRWLGLPMPWWLYWLGVATVVALLLRRRFDVAF